MNCIQETNKEIKAAMMKPIFWKTIALIFAGLIYLCIGVIGVIAFLHWMNFTIVPAFFAIAFASILLVAGLIYGMMVMDNCGKGETE